ncbi:MAG: hypothetical protein GXP62_16605 [Oligoflexia bacterium]|nr:hypothetical protein [Oligoflexia bacterium]
MDLNHGDTICGLSVTGRKLIGPASDLVELDSDSGLRHTAVVFHPEYRGHNAISSALDVVLGFLESPMVTGLVELVGVDQDQGAFVYPTGEAWSVAEVIRLLADYGEPAGVRAGLELMYACGQILVEAADAGDNIGVYSHGGLTPWRVMLKRDGQVLAIGYALPQVEILQFHENERRVPREDSFRYCPPERIDAAPEDVSSDLFSLALIAFEIMTGKPVYDGLVNDIRQQAARGEGSRRLFRFREVLPQSVRDLLTYALRPDREDRYPSGDDFLESVRAVLSSPDSTGPSLMDLMMRVSTMGKRTGTALEGGKTQMLSKDQLMAMLDDDPGAPGFKSSGDGVKGRSAAATWSPPPGRVRRRSHRSSTSASSVGDQSGDQSNSAAPQTDGASASQQPAKAQTKDGDAPVSRWSKGPRRSRRSRGNVSAVVDSSGSKTPQASPLTTSALGAASAGPLTAAAPPEALSDAVSGALSSSGEKARDLLAEIRSSADREIENDDDAADGTAARLIDEITRSSCDNGNGARVRKGRTRRSPRVRPAGPPSIPALERSTPPSPAVSRRVNVQVSVPVGASDAAPLAGPGDETPKPAAAAAPAAVASPAGSPVARAGTRRSPDPILAVSSGETVSLQLRRGPKARPMRLRLPGDITTADAISRLVGHVLPLRTDLSGGLAGWWRMAQGDRSLSGAQPLSQLDCQQPIDIVLVENVLVTVEILVPSSDPPARMLARVGTAVPAVSIADHLAQWLALPAGQWRLFCDGTLLGPQMILADLAPLAARPVLKLEAAP